MTPVTTEGSPFATTQAPAHRDQGDSWALNQYREEYRMRKELDNNSAHTFSSNLQLHGSRRCNAALVSLPYLWDNCSTIRYSFNDGTDIQREKVEECMHLWEPYVNLSFSKVSLGGDVRISFEQNGCWSYLAKTCESAAAGEPTMGLGCVKETLPMNDSEKRFILHELGHMLGMIHEHQSPATNGVLTFKRQPTLQHFKDVHHFSEEDVEHDVLYIYEMKKVSPCFSSFDKYSIMIYTFPSRVTQEGVHIPINYNLSDMDKSYMFLHYPRMKPHPEAPEWTIQHALEVANITGDRREEILQAKSPDQIREIFQQWHTEEVSSLTV